MAWHLPYRPTPLYCAVSAALLCAMGSATLLPAAKAATVGKTTITSAQHEPLVAVISVSDIQASSFSAQLANPVVYKQLGLTPTDSMSVSFIPTSATSGQLMISTSRPVSKPFADVVLAINDNGQHNVIPKTLLMPLGAAAPSKQTNRSERSTPMAASTTKPNLPVVSARTVAASQAEPLALKRGAPPPLFAPTQVARTATNSPDDARPMTVISVATPPNLPIRQTASNAMTTAAANIGTPANSTNRTPANTPTAPSTLDIDTNRRVASRTNSSAIATDDLSANRYGQAINTTTATNVKNEGATKSANPPVPISATTNVQQSLLSQNKANNPDLASSILASNETATHTLKDKASFNDIKAKNSTLNIEVTRQISVRNSPINQVNSTSYPALALNFEDKLPAFSATDMATTDDTGLDKVSAESVDSLIEPAQSDAAASKATEEATSSVTAASANREAMQEAAQADSVQPISYTVQRNDNLWLISKQIADQNRLDISAVMSQIKAQNPDAFINQDADQLKANAELRLPSYQVIPSEKSIQAAIAAQRQRYRQTNKSPSQSATDTQNNATTSVTEQIAKAKPTKPTITAKTTAQTLPQARFSVIAPGRQGQADGTQTQSTTASGNGLSTEILASLKSSRQRTASQAQRAKLVSNSLGSYTQKLQLQNQKLAELEARLKELRNQ